MLGRRLQTADPSAPRLPLPPHLGDSTAPLRKTRGVHATSSRHAPVLARPLTQRPRKVSLRQTLREQIQKLFRSVTLRAPKRKSKTAAPAVDRIAIHTPGGFCRGRHASAPPPVSHRLGTPPPLNNSRRIAAAMGISSSPTRRTEPSPFAWLNSNPVPVRRLRSGGTKECDSSIC